MDESQHIWWELLGHRVAVERTRQGVTQRDLAETCGLSRPSIANLERGEQHVSAWTLSRIAGHLDIEMCRLIPWEP